MPSVFHFFVRTLRVEQGNEGSNLLRGADDGSGIPDLHGLREGRKQATDDRIKFPGQRGSAEIGPLGLFQGNAPASEVT